MKKKLLILLSISISLSLSGTTYYVSPDGKDSNPGSIGMPFFTLNKAWTVISAGDIVYLRGGTYFFPTSQELTGKNGTAGNPIKIWAYPGETPIITKAGGWSYFNREGIHFEGDYFHWKGIEIKGFIQLDEYVMVGFRTIYSSHNIFELLNCHENSRGFELTEGCNDNLILNCDFHHNYDPLSTDSYGNADGLSANPDNGTTNIIRGCRSWNNSDDGYDIFRCDGLIILDDCWSWMNGYREDGSTGGGDGYGYKLGITNTDRSTTHLRTVTNCLAFHNREGGFGLNEAKCICWLFNNTAYHNNDGTGYYLGFWFDGQDGIVHILKNNIAYANQNTRGLEAKWTAESTQDHNSWDGGITVTDADFVTVNSTGVDGPRQTDGSLPDLNFLKLAKGSTLIDAGLDVELPYSGKAPDLGAFEMQTDAPNPIPVFTSAIVENATPSLLEITYNLTLNNLLVPANSSFNVQINSATRTVNSVAIVGGKVRLTLANAIVYGDIVTVTYTKPSINPLQTVSGGIAGSFSNQSVTNNCASIIPVYISSVIENATPAIIEMTYNLSLANKVPATSAFNVQVNSVARTINSIAIVGGKVRLTLASAVVLNDLVTITYTKPSINPLITSSGGVAASIIGQTVKNNCQDPNKSNNPPVLVIKNETTSYSGFVGEIDASGSYDLNNDNLTYEWTVPNNVSVSATNTSRIKFLSPIVNTSQIIEFQLKVTDGTAIVSKSIPINIVPYKPELNVARIINIEASNNQAPDFPNNISDGNLATKWSAIGDNNWLLLKLAEPFKISHLQLAFLTGQKYNSYFDIYASKDKLIWEPILINAASCDFSGNIQVFNFPLLKINTGYSFVKLVGHGNSLNYVNTISEFKIFGLRQQNPSTSDAENRNVIIYPNPAGDFFNISIEEPTFDPDIIRLIDFSGRIVFEDKFGQGIKNIQIPSLIKSGVYIMELLSGNLTLFSQKLVVNR